MELINRNDASGTPAPRQLATLVNGIRSLWAVGLPAATPGREQLISELTALDLAAERLVIRASADHGNEEMAEILARSQDLTSLERRWYESAAATAAQDAA